ncbi:DDB1- and CUL4-associated factor 11 [Toxorhynchites rutilus septentrionalis]|uniref:DDB1- and CUL4-associated factor 11 n=1 Tax=Toxorhynchites rutilus septentrionalis TaxID=329112 RepID=UPI0024783D34|nr:DDB1- and CUL4-associated factor 11 [Toxorhynchites rutilus septentrionalis]XP_055644898.1 DDB1- and CUL4-associated factor 11 [Toxorhynchites rutilus septentrionalis]XP_055644899.1 DDB1- and CUL4-associated factor 11 [Toxorhynchites rutilus septentrionalis]
MGNIVLRSRGVANMSDIEFEDNIDIEEDDLYDETAEAEAEDALSENHLVSILRQLINSGEIQVLNSEHFYSMSLPVIKRRPNLDKLKKSAIYQSIKQASGYGAGRGSPMEKFSLPSMLASRQSGFGPKGGAFVQNEKCKIGNVFVPNRTERTISNCNSKVFCGRFSRDGSQFFSASQDSRIRIFDATTSRYRMTRQIEAKNVSWSILDIDFSPDGEYFVYSTWADALFISRMRNTVTDKIHCLFLRPDNQKFGVFTVAYSNCGKQILAGANDGCLYAYDLVGDRRVLMVLVAEEKHDVNAVGFLDETSNIFFSGTDNGVIKIWDRRCLNEVNPAPAGVLVGHYDGITYIDSRNDGRYIISNSKDQSIKLWDLRVFSPSNAEEKARLHLSHGNWDYRWDEVPKKFYNPTKSLEGDTSVMTYRGHRVQKSLIRAKFSPAATTGQRYIYTGCGTGRLIIYDTLTGKIVQAIESHRDTVRDVAWHPQRPEVLTCSWDFHVNLQTYQCAENTKNVYFTTKTRRINDVDDGSDDESPPLRRSRRIAELRRTQSSLD